MKRAYYLILTAGLCLSGLSAPAYAQSGGYDAAQFGQTVEARIGVSLPFGGDYKKANAKPQLAFGLRSEQRDWALPSLRQPQDTREIKLALTLEAEPNLLLNDQLMQFGGDGFTTDGARHAMDSYDKTILTVIGVSLAVIAGSIIIIADD